MSDILDATEAIERFTRGFDEEQFLGDELVQSAVLHKLSVVGEAAARVSQATRDETREVPWKEIIGFRNVAIHAYFSVDWRVVFGTVVGDLPLLKDAVSRFLRATPGQ